MQRFAPLLAVFLGLAFAWAKASHAQVEPPPTFTVLHLNNREGDLNPCGCPKRPLGGLARHVHLASTFNSQGPTVVVDAGDALFKELATPAGMQDQAQDKARIIAAAYGRTLDAFVPGQKDWAQGGAFAVNLFRQHHVPVVAANLVDAAGASPFPAHRTKVWKGFTLLVVGVVDPDTLPAASSLRATDPVVALQRALDSAPPHDMALLLTSAAPDRAALWAAQVPRFSLVAVGSTGVLFFVPRTVNLNGPLKQAALFGSSRAGKYVGVARVFVRPGQSGVADAEGYAKARNMLGAVQEKLRQAPQNATALAEQRQHQDVVARVEAQTHLRFELLGLDQQLPEDDATAQEVAVYNRANAARESAQAPPPAAGPSAPAGIPVSSPFVGAQACKGCHQQAYEVWENMDHAHALESLKSTQQHLDRECIGCHSVGWQQPGGFHDPARVAGFANVQCESCHGPGRAHVLAGGAKNKIRRGQGESTCRACHTADTTPQFVFETDRLRIRHWK